MFLRLRALSTKSEEIGLSCVLQANAGHETQEGEGFVPFHRADRVRQDAPSLTATPSEGAWAIKEIHGNWPAGRPLRSRAASLLHGGGARLRHSGACFRFRHDRT